MKKIEVKILGLFIMMALVLTGTSFADENVDQLAKENAALKNQVSSLNGKMDALERQVQVLANSDKGGTTYVPSAAEGGALQGITVSGFVDTQYNNNLSDHTNNPANTTNAPGNVHRSFDRNQNTFTLNNVEIDIEKLANPEGGAGFRVDLSAGEDMAFIDQGTLGGASNRLNGTDNNSKFGFQQAYVQLVAPLNVFDGNEVFGNTVDIKAGRMVTLAGTEVIEGRDNWNISRGFLFGLAIPFTHTGVRATYKLFNDQVTTYMGLNNGWDANVDNNTWKTWEGGFTVNPLENLSYTAAAYYGPENAQTASRKRFVMSNVVSYQATEKLATKAEFTFGNQRRTVTSINNATGLGATPDATLTYDNAAWWGLGLHARYALTEKWGMAYRFELFRDKNRFRTNAGGASPQLGTQTMTSHTIGTDYKVYENLLARFEYRMDRTNDDEHAVFNDDTSQSTLGAQLIYSFA